jgi:integrase
MDARQKTDIMSIIPLLPVAENILLKYSPTGNCRDFVWKVPSNQKLNASLKEIAKKAGVEKILFMHLARHTFATTITLSHGVSIESVSKMLGHTTLKHTHIYAKIVASKVKDDMSKLMGIFS